MARADDPLNGGLHGDRSLLREIADAHDKLAETGLTLS